MLYLHCGLPRTSTTSLQIALHAHRNQLADAGLIYPDLWLASAYPSHSKLFGAMNALRVSREPLDRLEELVEANRGSDLLLSDENLTYRLMTAPGQDILLAFLDAAQRLTPAKCVWTLRRFDDMRHSLYLRRLASGIPLPPPAERLGDFSMLDELFVGMGRVAEAVNEVAYVRYDTGGAHNDELLRVFGMPDRIVAGIREQTTRGPRLNASLSHKQAVVLLNLEEASARASVPLDRGTVARAFHNGDLKFEDDWRCELIGGELRREAHERALAAARRNGFKPYVEFFGEDEILGPDFADLSLAALTNGDVEHLAASFS
jgi:hypothetical protein